MCGTVPCTGAEQALREEKIRPVCTYREPFQAPPLPHLGELLAMQLPGLWQAAGNLSVRKSVKRRKGGSFKSSGKIPFSSSLHSFKPNPQTTPIPRNKGASLDRPLFVFWFQSKQVMQEDREKSPTVGTGGGRQADLSRPGLHSLGPSETGGGGKIPGVLWGSKT